MSNHITITGRLADDLEIRFTPTGKCVGNFAVADTPRRKNPQTGEWEDAGETLWLRGSIWGDQAEALAEQARKGDLVCVVGRLEARSFDTKAGEKRTVTEIKADAIAVVQKKGQRGQGGGFGAPATQQADPWAAPQQQGGGWNAEAPF